MFTLNLTVIEQGINPVSLSARPPPITTYGKTTNIYVLVTFCTNKHEIFNPLILFVHKDIERVVVDAYVYHKYCKSHWHES